MPPSLIDGKSPAGLAPCPRSPPVLERRCCKFAAALASKLAWCFRKSPSVMLWPWADNSSPWRRLTARVDPLGLPGDFTKICVPVPSSLLLVLKTEPWLTDDAPANTAGAALRPKRAVWPEPELEPSPGDVIVSTEDR